VDIFLDTSFILSLIIRTEKTEEARKFYMEATFNPVASVAVYEESLYTGLRLVAEKRLNIKNAYSLRNFIKKNGYDFAVDFVNTLHELFGEIQILQDVRDIDLVRFIAERYKLLPNDALIAATCKHYGIRKIATFDEDFKRVDFLEVIEV
jgi:hypothetical protein